MGVGGSAHLLLVFPANVLGLVAGFACYFHALARVQTPRVGLQVGAVFGLALAASSLYWLIDVLQVLTLGERMAGSAVVGGFLLLVALPYGLWGFAARWVAQGPANPWLLLLHAPGLLLAQALIHDAWLGFPWLHSGYWLAFGPFGNWLGVLGAQGAGLLPLCLAAAVGLWSQTPRAPRLALVAAAVLCLGLLLPAGAPPSSEARPIQVATITIAPPMVGDSARDDLTLLSHYVAATQAARADWVVWPESVIRDGDANLAPLGEVLGRRGGPVFAGALLAAPAGRYNALVELRAGQPVHYKQKLVPFSEYVPGELLRRLFAAIGVHTLKTNVSTGPLPQRAFEVDGVAVQPLLCYEVAFTELVAPEERPGVLLNVGNESWFRSAILHRMTLAMGVARAREYGLPLVRSVAGGHSGFFEPASGTWWETGQLLGPAMLHRAPLVPRPAATPYSRWRRMLR
ncbi:MAG: apolipoprotein N-acyltransferase [Myxococcaceae bacterium]|nr:apolipoprotein N-acyltransferase [Myxococcaceae bacterium]